VNEDIAHELDQMRDRQFGRERLRFTYASRVADGEVTGVRRTTWAGGGSTVELTLERVARLQNNAMRSGLNSISADEIVEHGVKYLLLGEPLPQAISSGFGFFAETGIDPSDLRQAFDLPNEIVEAITRLVITEGLVASGNASRVIEVHVGPRLARTWTPSSPPAQTGSALRCPRKRGNSKAGHPTKQATVRLPGRGQEGPHSSAASARSSATAARPAEAWSRAQAMAIRGRKRRPRRDPGGRGDRDRRHRRR
jgi:hypothetical protein